MPALDQVLELLDRRFGVETLWVFGSEADGRVRADSDLDVAVLFREPPSPLELAELGADAAAAIGRSVDLVDLDSASPLLGYQVLKHGRLMVDRDPSRRHAFATLLPSRREDLLITRRPVEKRLIERVARGEAGG